MGGALSTGGGGMLGHLPDSAMKVYKAGRSFGVVNSLEMLMFRPPRLCRSFCLALLRAGQCRMKCATDSLLVRQAVQIGESLLLIR